MNNKKEKNQDFEKKWLDVNDLALYLNCSKSTIYHKVSKGKIPHSKKVGLRFFLPDIDKWLLEHDYFRPDDAKEWAEANPAKLD